MADTRNLFISLLVLQNSGVDRTTMFAASAAAAMMNGPLGLALPLIVAANARSRSRAVPGTPTGVTPVLTTVPKVTDMHEDEALVTLADASLHPVVTRAYFKNVDGNAPPKDIVATQDPAPSANFVNVGTEVRLEVSLGPPPEPTDGTTTEEEILDIEKELQDKMVKMDKKMDLLLREVGATVPSGPGVSGPGPSGAGFGTPSP